MGIVSTFQHFGATLSLQDVGSLATDRYGLSTANAQWWYFGESPESQVSIFSAHPRWSFLNMDRRTIKHAGAHWLIEGSYFGVDGTPSPLYEMDVSAGQDPIETHKDFADFAGTPTAPLHGAQFDDDGLFIGFKPTDDEDSADWVGVRDYLTPGAIWRKSYVTKAKPGTTEFNLIGRLDFPEGSAPTPSGRNWLYTGLSWEQKGLTYSVRKEWKLSGRNGWNSTIYA